MFRMNPKVVWSVIIVLAVSFGCYQWFRPRIVWRDAEYWAVISESQKARTIEPVSKSDGVGNTVEQWVVDLPLDAGQKAFLRAEKGPNANAVVIYPDKSEKALYPGADYTNALRISTDQGQLYVLRAITLFHNEFRLVRFDVPTGIIVADRRVDPDDLRRAGISW